MRGETRLVVDASVAIKWLIDEEDSDIALAFRDEDMIAPALLRVEASNVLRTLVSRKAIATDTALSLLDLLQRAPVDIADHDDALERRALEIALKLEHPVYDCFYLALAERTGRTLITADKRFVARALGADPKAPLRSLSDLRPSDRRLP